MVGKIRAAAESIFNGAWSSASVWEWSSMMLADYERYGQPQIDEKEKVFFGAVSEQLDFSGLEKLSVALGNIAGRLSVGTPIVGNNAGSNNGIDHLLQSLDITEDGCEHFKNLCAASQNYGINAIMEDLKILVGLYQITKPVFSLTASLLLHYIPPDVIADLDDFDREFYYVSALKEVGKKIEVFPKFFRFLGQSFFSGDLDTREWVVIFLSDFDVDKTTLDRIVDKLLFIALLHISFYDIGDIIQTDMRLFVGRYLWWGMQFGVPVEKRLEELLAARPHLNDYLLYSIDLSDNLLNSKAILSFSAGSVRATVGEFINEMALTAGDKVLAGYAQVDFVDDYMRRNKLPAQLRDHLLKLLHIYVHLRECDFIDYRGFLSGENLKERMNWSALLNHNLDEAHIEEIKRYLNLIQTPARMKIELLAAFRRLNWREEPYLSRVLILNDIFEQVYGHDFSPLVYFDAETMEWKLDISFPEPWLRDMLELVGKEDIELVRQEFLKDVEEFRKLQAEYGIVPKNEVKNIQDNNKISDK